MNENHPVLTAQQTAALLSEPKNTVILFHARPDGDAVGSAFALRALLQKMGMQAFCLCADEVPARLRFLTDGVQQSVLESALPDDFQIERVVSVDTASPAQLGLLADRWLARVDMMIDHHAVGTPYAPAWVDPAASATGELLFSLSRLWLESGVIDSIPEAVDTCLYAAIASDTGGFRYSNVTERTFLCAAELRRCGVDTPTVNHLLFECKPMAQLRAEHLGFARMQLWRGGRVAVIPFPYALKTEHGIADAQLETLVDVGRSVAGVEIVLVVRQPADTGSFRVSTRSSGAFCVSSLCARFGGGGHAKAAGCTVEAQSMEEALAILSTALDEEIALQDA